jgi:putative two-component system response regulator
MEPTEQSLAAITDLMRSISRITDPQEMVRTYKARARGFLAVDRTVSLSRRDLPDGQYRITRSDIWERDIDPWKERDQLPVLHGGLLGELIQSGEARIIDDLQVAPDDPAAEHLAGMASLAAIPHFDDGAALNMVIHLCREKRGFDRDAFPQLVVMSGLFGRAMHGLVAAQNLQRAQSRLQEQYEAVTHLSDVILEQSKSLRLHAATLEERVHQRTTELEEAHIDAIYMIAAASEAKDEATGDHVRRLQRQSYALARALGYGEREALAIGRAAILHDVGKLHVPDEILKKPGPLTDAERQVMQGHTLAGEQILPNRPYFAQARRIARSHHENWDGSGYPDGLCQDAIPCEARIVHLVDVFDALTNARPYKLAWAPDQALAHIEKESGKMFEPAAVKAFLALQHEHRARRISV